MYAAFTCARVHACLQVRPYCPCEAMDSEDPLFILYTSGSTGERDKVTGTTAATVPPTTLCTHPRLCPCSFRHVFALCFQLFANSIESNRIE